MRRGGTADIARNLSELLWGIGRVALTWSRTGGHLERPRRVDLFDAEVAPRASFRSVRSPRRDGSRLRVRFRQAPEGIGLAVVSVGYHVVHRSHSSDANPRR